jgi:hypothetical protein
VGFARAGSGSVGTAPGEDRDLLLDEAASLVRRVAASLAPERSAGYLSAPQVVEVLDAAARGLAPGDEGRSDARIIGA